MNYEDEEYDNIPSKTQRKKEMHALQDLGKQLTELSDNQLASLELPEDLRLAITEMHRIRQNEARRRHLQYIGKVMRKIDSDAIQTQLDALNAKHSLNVQLQHQIEHWRDQLLEGQADVLQQFIDKYPHVDIQHLRQLIRSAQKELSQGKPPAHARKLFRFLRDTVFEQQ